MKSFKEFQTESYSKLDEGAWNAIKTIAGKGLSWTGAGTGYDIAKPRHKEGNPYVKKTVQSLVTFPKTTMKAAKFLAWDLPKGVLGIAGALKGR